MDQLAKQLHASISLNLFAEAARLSIPLLKEEYEEISNAASYAQATGELGLASLLQFRADKLLEALITTQIALKEAGPLVKPAVRVVDHLDGDPRNSEISNLRFMVRRP